MVSGEVQRRGTGGIWVPKSKPDPWARNKAKKAGVWIPDLGASPLAEPLPEVLGIEPWSPLQNMCLNSLSYFSGPWGRGFVKSRAGGGGWERGKKSTPGSPEGLPVPPR